MRNRYPQLIMPLLLSLLFSNVCFAGYGYRHNDIDIYDSISNLYYKAIPIKTEKKHFLSSGEDKKLVNLAIYNPLTDKHQLLFAENTPLEISFILFEMAIKDQEVVYNDHSYHIKNNHVPNDRAIKNKLLVVIRDDANKQNHLWVADKQGNDLKKLVSVPFRSQWHIDVKNSKLRVIDANHGKFQINSYDW